MLKPFVVVLLGLAAAPLAVRAASNDRLNLYCSTHALHCVEMATAFQRATGIGVNTTYLDPTDALTRIKGETDAPRGDVWWGGSYLMHLEAASEDLTQEYEPPRLWQLHAWAVIAAQRSGYRAFPIHAMPQRFAIDAVEHSTRRQAPSCWKDLMASSPGGRVDIGLTSNFSVALAAITPLSALIGESQAVDVVLRHQADLASHSTKSDDRKILDTPKRVSLIIDERQDLRQSQAAGWTIVTPCEGTSFTMSAVSIIRGTYNFTGAEAWLDWVLSAEGQAVSRKAYSALIPSHRSVPIPAEEIDRADLFLSGQPLLEAMSYTGQSRLRTRLQTTPLRRLEQ